MYNSASKLLPYALLFFIGVAAWALESTTLLGVVVFGVCGVAIGTAWITQSSSSRTN